MIVPFCVIPMQYMLPLHVETKMEYNINKRRFPGLNDKRKSREPALLIAENREMCPFQETPLDFTKRSRATRKSSSSAAPNTAPNSHCHFLRARLSSRSNVPEARGLSKATTENPEETSQIDTSVINAETRTRLFGVPETIRRNYDVMARVTSQMDRPMGRTQISIPENNEPIRESVSGSAHPSYLDFIYGENGILSKAASKSKRVTQQQTVHPCLQATAPTTVATVISTTAAITAPSNKRKRSAETTNSEQSIAKKMKPGSDTLSEDVHTIHYLPLNLQEDSTIKKPKNCTDRTLGEKVNTIHYLPTNSQEVPKNKIANYTDVNKWFNPIGGAGALAFGSHYGQIMVDSVPSRPTCGRQS